MDDLLTVLEEPAGCGVSEMASEWSTESEGSKRAAMECEA